MLFPLHAWCCFDDSHHAVSMKALNSISMQMASNFSLHLTPKNASSTLKN